MEDYKRIIELIRYGSEEELENMLVEFIKRNWDTKDNRRTIRRLFYGIRFEPRRRVKKAFLKAVAETGIWDPEILDTIFAIAKDDPEPEVKELAEKAALEVLRKTDEKDKGEALVFILKAIDMRLIYLSPVDAVNVAGSRLARKLLDDENVPANVKELINYALKNI